VDVVFPSPAMDDAPEDDWMGVLASCYAAIRGAHPTDELCVVFDIDGTILDLRHLVAHALLVYDRDRGTDLFHGLVAGDITVAENRIEALLESLGVPDDQRDDIAAFYRFHLWDEDGVLAASAPYRGVLSVIRWFQIQPGTRIALNTGRPEKMRRITIDSMNAIGDAARVRFEPELLFMRSDGTAVPDGKVAALDEICAEGSGSWLSSTTSPRTSRRWPRRIVATRSCSCTPTRCSTRSAARARAWSRARRTSSARSSARTVSANTSSSCGTA
jgi:phosphoglycolate phosphatase-like HAD superfamily hydrolase